MVVLALLMVSNSILVACCSCCCRRQPNKLKPVIEVEDIEKDDDADPTIELPAVTPDQGVISKADSLELSSITIIDNINSARTDDRLIKNFPDYPEIINSPPPKKEDPFVDEMTKLRS
jgi:hypothetical protein